MKFASLFLASLSLVITSQAAAARDSFVEAVQQTERAPAGATVAVGIRVPLGVERNSERRTVYGITASYGTQFESNHPADIPLTRQVELAQLNFDGSGARDLQVANFSLTQFGRDDVDARRVNLDTGETILVVGGVAVAVLIVAFLATDDEDFNFFEE